MDKILEKLRTVIGSFAPEWGLVLGSGLGFFAEDQVDRVAEIAYGELPGFPVSTVPGHAGRFVFGRVSGVPVMCMQGRFHYYEGYSMDQVVLPIRLMAVLGVQNLILTNAAGGIRDDLNPGTLMLLSDHINMLGCHPLRGPNHDDLGPRFPDMSEAYDAELRGLAKAVAASQGTELAEGVYLATSGPSFETPAEIRAFRSMGADAVGMSTVPECLVARHAGMKVLGLSCITNRAAGLGTGTLSHEEVALTAAKVQGRFASLLSGVIGTK